MVTSPRVRWLAGARKGLPAIARNRGIRESRGDVVMFLDDDVVLDRQYLAAVDSLQPREPRIRDRRPDLYGPIVAD